MSVTLIGLMWMSMLTISSLFGIKSLILCVLLSSVFQAGEALTVGNSIITPFKLSCIWFIVFYFTKYRKIKLCEEVKTFCIFWIITLTNSIIAAVFFKGVLYVETSEELNVLAYDGSIKIMGICVLTIYMLTAVCMYSTKGYTYEDLHKAINFIVIVVALIGVWQYLSLLHIIPNNSTVATLIYGDNSGSKLYYADIDLNKSNIFQIRFFSTFKEPAHSSGFLIMSLIFYMLLEKKSKLDIVMEFIILIMIGLTFSTTAYIATLLMVLICMIYNRKTKLLLKIIKQVLIALCGFIIIISRLDLWSKIERVTVGKTSSFSAKVRFAWNENCIDVFKKTFFVGMGYGNTSGNGLAYTLLGTVGILGIILYFIFLISILKPIYSKKYKKNKQVVSSCFMVLGVLVCQFVAIGNIDYSIFWMSLFMVELLKNSNFSMKREMYEL